MSTFPAWMTRTYKALGIDSDAEFARLIDSPQSNVSRWRNKGVIPDMKKLREIADTLDLPIQEILVAAGWVRPDEVGIVPAKEVELADISNRELVGELWRRLGEDEDAGLEEVTDAMRSSKSLDQSLPKWQPPKRKR